MTWIKKKILAWARPIILAQLSAEDQALINFSEGDVPTRKDPLSSRHQYWLEVWNATQSPEGQRIGIRLQIMYNRLLYELQRTRPEEKDRIMDLTSRLKQMQEALSISSTAEKMVVALQAQIDTGRSLGTIYEELGEQTSRGKAAQSWQTQEL